MCYIAFQLNKLAKENFSVIILFSFGFVVSLGEYLIISCIFPSYIIIIFL